MVVSKNIILPIAFVTVILNFSSAQSNIRIDDTLAAHAEVLDLHMGHVFMGKVKKFHFGQYKMDKYKSGYTNTKNNNNFLGTKRESSTSHQSSFILRDSSNNAAQVVMLHHTKTKTQQNLILGLVDFGEHETESLDYFTSWITINGDTSDTWTLFIGSSAGIHVPEKNEAFMTNGKRNIILGAVTASNRGFSRLGLPSMGYEFIEDGQSIAALQFFSGEFNKVKNTVWIDTRLSSSMKHVLATAMTAIVRHANTSGGLN